MHLAIEASLLVQPPYSGIARCTRELIEALADQSDPPTIDIYYPRRGADLQHVRALSQHPSIECRVDRYPQLRATRNYDLTFASANRLVPNMRGPSALWLHDFYLQLGISSYDELLRRKLLQQMQTVYEGSDHFICISEATKRDALALLHVPEDRLHVVHHGISARFRPLDAAQYSVVKVRHKLPRPYLLFVGLFYENKNLSRLLAAYARSTVRHTFDLAIAGPLPSNDAASLRLHHLIELNGIQNQIRLLGPVSDEDLIALYGGASAFVFPSLYEGFGMPILEAMRCGTPVLTSNVSACPEVAGGYAELVDPYDLDALAAGLEKVVNRTATQRDAARTYAESFTWSKTAKKMLEVFKKIAAS